MLRSTRFVRVDGGSEALSRRKTCRAISVRLAGLRRFCAGEKRYRFAGGRSESADGKRTQVCRTGTSGKALPFSSEASPECLGCKHSQLLGRSSLSRNSCAGRQGNLESVAPHFPQLEGNSGSFRFSSVSTEYNMK